MSMPIEDGGLPAAATAADRPSSPAQRRELDRRRFLGGMGVVVGAAASGLVGMAAAEGTAGAVEVGPDSHFQRANRAFDLRLEAALRERAFGSPRTATNGDEERYSTKINNFSKTLPHNTYGEVDLAAYGQLVSGVANADYAALELVPRGGVLGFVGALGGYTFNIFGPDSEAITTVPPPALSSPQWAAQMVELYWMALLRDVPFSEYPTNALVAQACDDLSRLSGYTGPRDPATGRVTPQVLFRLDYPGVTVGPMVSQFLLQPYRLNGLDITQRIDTWTPGLDFLTYYPEWLDSQNGFAAFPAGQPGDFDSTQRYLRTARDLGAYAFQDFVLTAYHSAALVASGFGLRPDAANPYLTSHRQGGFSTFAIAHLLQLISSVAHAERECFFQKWSVHRSARPEAGGGIVHNAVAGARPYPIHSDLRGSAVLPLVFEHNRQQNLARLGFDAGSYMLPMGARIGAPNFPSYPAGHAVTAGACVTALKAWFDESRPFPAAVEPTPDGTALVPYTGPTLTVGGELNKLAHNLSLGRDMSGIHWRADTQGGHPMGEEMAIRILREDRTTYPEPFTGFSLTRFDGETITI